MENYSYTNFQLKNIIKNESDSSAMSNSPSPQEISFEDNHSERGYNMTAITTSLSSDSLEETSLTEEIITKNKSKKKKKPVIKKRVLKKKKTPSQKKILSDVPIEIVKGNKVYFHPRNLLSIDPNSTAAKNILKETKKKVRNSDFEILEFTSATRSVDDILELLWEAINGIYIPMSSCNELFISQEHLEDVYQMMVKRAHQPKIPEPNTVVRFNWNQYKEKLSDPMAKSKISNRRKERRRKRERIQQVADKSTKKRVSVKPKSEDTTSSEMEVIATQFEEEINFSRDEPFDQNDLIDYQNDDGFFSLFEEDQLNLFDSPNYETDKNSAIFPKQPLVPQMLDFAPRFGVVHSPNFLHITGEHLSSTSLIPLYYVFPHNSPTSSASPLSGTSLSIENQRMFISLPSFSEPCSLWIFLQVPFTTTVTTCPNPMYHVLSLNDYNSNHKRQPNGTNGDGTNDFNGQNGGNTGFGGGSNGGNSFGGGSNGGNSFGGGSNGGGFNFNGFGGGNNFNGGNNGGNLFDNNQPTPFKEGGIWHLACASGNLNMINFLYQKKVPGINSRDENGKTPLMWAILNSHINVVKLLFKLGAKFNLSDNDGNTALHISISKNEPAIIEYMLHCGSVDVNILNKESESALDFALALDNVPLIKILLAHPSTMPRNSITYWIPECPNLKKWWYNTKDLENLTSFTNDEFLKKTMSTRIELELYNSELKKELTQTKVDFEEFSKRSQNEIQKLRKSWNEKKEKIEQISDNLILSKKNNRTLTDTNTRLSNKVNELNDVIEQKDIEISILKEQLEKERQLRESGNRTPENKPRRIKKKISFIDPSKSIARYSPKSKLLKKTQSSKSLSPKYPKELNQKNLSCMSLDHLGSFNVKQIYSSIVDQVSRYTSLKVPLNYHQMNDNDVINYIIQNDSEQSLKTILSEIMNAVEDGGIKNKLELSNAVKIAVQMRYTNN